MNKFIRIIFLLGVLAFIYYMSSRNAFDSNVYNVELIKLLNNRYGVDLYGLYGSGYVDFAVRKLGHFFEFLLLSCALYFVLSAFKVRKATIFTIIFCLFFGMLDEFHQLFVQGRSSSMVDMAIDSMGSITAVSVISLLKIIRYEILKKGDKYFAGNKGDSI